MQVIEVQQGQNLLDVSVEYTGKLGNLFAIALMNGNISITDDLTAGNAMQVDDSLDVVNKKNLDYYKKKAVHPATGATDGLQGIGYWSIGQNLIVG